MFVIGSVSKTPNEDEYAYDVELFYSFNFIDYLDLFDKSFWETGQKFMQKIEKSSFAKLPIITEELIRKIDSAIPPTKGRGDLLMFLITNMDKKLLGANVRV